MAACDSGDEVATVRTEQQENAARRLVSHGLMDTLSSGIIARTLSSMR